jgi:hypothetical protein
MSDTSENAREDISETEAPKAPKPEGGAAHASGVLPIADDHTLPPLTPEQDAHRKKSRNAALLSVATFLAAIFGLDGAFRASQVAKRLQAENLYITKANAFSDSREGADVAVTGDSRILHGFNPKAAEAVVKAERGETIHAYNAGLSGAPPMAQLAWVRRLLTHPHKPRVVVMSISPYMFSSKIAAAMARESLTTMYRLRDVPSLVMARAPAEDVFTALNAGLFESARLRPRMLDVLLKHSGTREAVGTGEQGFLQNGEVDPNTQAIRGRDRAIGYRTEMWRPATFGNEHQGYFVEALRELRAAGVPTIVLNSPSASQLELAYGPNSIYDEHIAWVRAQADRFGATFADVRNNPAVHDEDFNDGDHLGGDGAARFTAWLTHERIVPAMGGAKPDRPAACKVVFALDEPGAPGWTQTGEGVGDPIAQQGRRGQSPVLGSRGTGFLSTFGANGDAATATITSPDFVLDGSEVRVRVAGGAGQGLEVALVIDGQVRASARGANDETLRDVVWPTAADRGKKATIRVRDDAKGGWGHLVVDDVAVCP